MYTAPTEDMQFLIDDVLEVGRVLGELPQYADLGLGPELTTAVLDEAAKFAADVVSPLRRVGDAQPASCHDGVVTIPLAMVMRFGNWVPVVGWAFPLPMSRVVRACLNFLEPPLAKCGTAPTWHLHWSLS